ncbi:MAG TPA: PAS domain S-box protein [Dongiaceae bacterium]|nr:PAS domain S-box protein [Dongiaceae bacterium]
MGIDRLRQVDTRSDPTKSGVAEWLQASQVIEGVSDIITVADAAGRFQLVNSAACDALGYSREELLTLSIPDILDPLEWPRFSARKKSNRKSNIFETWLSKKKDGTTFFAEVSVTVAGNGFIIDVR